jgi:hypothetical protein
MTLQQIIQFISQPNGTCPSNTHASVSQPSSPHALERGQRSGGISFAPTVSIYRNYHLVDSGAGIESAVSARSC